jgi:hypothetical protein
MQQRRPALAGLLRDGEEPPRPDRALQPHSLLRYGPCSSNSVRLGSSSRELTRVDGLRASAGVLAAGPVDQFSPRPSTAEESVVEEADDGSFLLTRIDVMAPVCAAPSLRAQRFIAPDEPAPASLNPELAAQTTARIPDRTRCRSSRSPACLRARARPPPRHLLATGATG